MYRKILLASNSPRRKELLQSLYRFEVFTLNDVDESYPGHLKGAEVAEYIARKKGAAYQNHLDSETLLITADTIVSLDGVIYGKPTDGDDACKMLRALSEKTHQVVTGVCLKAENFEKIFSVTTDVTFADLTDEEINYYIANYRPFDKAGSYGIQEWIGYVGVSSINGSFYNVMGLPIHRLHQEIRLMVDACCKI